MTAHRPESQADLEPSTLPRQRLAYDELLANQLALLLVRRRLKRLSGRPLKGDGRLRDRLEKLLPWPLTNAQRQANAEIAGDMAIRSEEHTSELQSLMRISYAVFCLKKKKHTKHTDT